VDELKIDKSFIDSIATNADAAGVVHAILRLARTLHLDTVAEGVEHHDQLHELAALGCGHVQGFHFSKAVPAADVGTLLNALPTAPTTRTP
jgi:EAL domain-containing protein (putative c-di-GMP-specific phosphodiesterase class I)